MSRHDLDPVALVFGALFTVVGLGYALAEWTWADVASAWVLALFLIVLGLAGIASTSRRRTTAGHDAPE